MRDESGDQTGSFSTNGDCVRLCGLAPLAFMMNSSGFPAIQLSNTIRVPSGETEGLPSKFGKLVRFTLWFQISMALPMMVVGLLLYAALTYPTRLVVH